MLLAIICIFGIYHNMMCWMTTKRMQKVPQFPFSDQLIQVVPKVPAVFCSMSVVLVVLTIQTLIALCGVFSHLIRPLKEWLILDFL